MKKGATPINQSAVEKSRVNNCSNCKTLMSKGISTKLCPVNHYLLKPLGVSTNKKTRSQNKY